MSANLVHVRGVDGFENVAGLPEGLRNLLSIHVRKLQKGDSDHYIINVAQAQEWAKTHPIPDDVKPTDVKNSDGHSGCKSFSWHCAEESAKHAQDEASRQADMMRSQATQDWAHASTELTKDWNEGEDCLADHTLHLDNIPIEFSVTPRMIINAQTQGKTSGGTASGQISGTLNLALPVTGNFAANLDVFYIPCLPFVIRPKDLGADGTMGANPTLTASLNASGKFDKSFPIPPDGGPEIPVEVLPIVIAGVPVAELDISVYFDGGIEVGGDGQLTATFEIDDPRQTAFNFNCSGQGCTSGRPPATSQGAPTTTETYKLQGKAFVTPDIYVALEMNFDYDAATVRSGPEPSLTGTMYGCGTATATQNLDTGKSSSTESHALVFDSDWKMILATKFLVGGTEEGDGWNPVLVGSRHILFKDLWPGGSNALLAAVAEPAQVTLGKPATFNLKMPACYPFKESVHYLVTLPADAVGTKSAACSWAGAQGTCTGDPTKNLPFNVTWSAAGTSSLSAVLHEDTLTPTARTFNGIKPTVVNVAVKQ